MFDEASEAFREAMALQAEGKISRAARAYGRVRGLDRLLTRRMPNGCALASPDFLIIGPPRAGTSWLKTALNRRPDVTLPRGEPSYFLRLAERPPTAYLESLGDRMARRRRGIVVGEKSPNYLAMSEDRIALCAALFPKVKLICLLREPTAQAWSIINHGREVFGLDANWTGAETDPPPPAEATLDAFRAGDAGRRLHGLLGSALYEANLRRWARHFAPEQFLLIDFDRIAREPETVIGEALAHIGADTASTPKMETEARAARDPPEPLRSRLVRLYGEIPWRARELRTIIEAEHQAARAGRRRPLKSRRHGPLTEDEREIWCWLIGLERRSLPAREARGRLLMAEGRPAEAAAELRQVVRARWDDGRSWWRLGRALLAAQQAGGARRAFVRAVKLRPDDVGMADRTARLLAQQGNPAAAASLLRDAAERGPDDPSRWRRLAALLKLTGDRPGRIEALERALAADPSDEQTRTRLSNLKAARAGEARG